MVAVIDYDAGNIMSVIKAAEHLEQTAKLTRDRNDILNADHVILPGVGCFGDCMQKLEDYELIPVIKEVADSGNPFIGICLGLQLMFEDSEESPGIKGLGLLKGKVKRIPDCAGLKIPNIGWNSLEFPREGRLFKGIEPGEFVYFVHSYYLDAADKSIVTATIEYSTHIEASVEQGNIFACQFHPEKSSDAGLKMLDNFFAIK